MSSRRVILAILAILAMLLPAYISSVWAQDFNTPHSRIIDLHPRPDFPVNQEVNLANVTSSPGNTPQLEKDSLSFPASEVGKFYGAYLRSSKFEFTYSRGGIFSFNATYNFTAQQVMSGVSTFWTRWPIDATIYDQYCFNIVGYFDPAFEAGPTLVENGTTYRRCSAANGGATFPNLLANCDVCDARLEAPLAPRLGDDVILDASGVYIKEYAWLMPNRNYTFQFQGHLKQDTPPTVWVTIERYQQQVNTTYIFANYLTGSSHNETLSLYPAFDFLFLSGMGLGGLTSYQIPFDGTNATYIASGHFDTTPAGKWSCFDHISVYLPFFGADVVNFTIRVWADVGGVATQEWSVQAQNWLLTSSPSTIFTMSGGVCDDFGQTIVGPAYWLWLYADRPIRILGAVPKNPVAFGIWSDRTIRTWYVHNDGRGGWGIPFTINPDDSNGCSIFCDIARTNQVVPAFILTDFTPGIWATVTPERYYTVYNFGWGKAYLFPGEVNLTMFLTNGTAIGFNSIGSITGPGASDQAAGCQVLQTTGLQNVTFHEILVPVAEWVNGLACFILQLIGNVVGFISSVFNAIWDGLVSIGKWLYNALFGLADLVVKVITAIVDAATQIALNLITALPFIMVLFVAGRGLPDVLEAKVRFGGRVRAGYSRGRGVGSGIRSRHEAKAWDKEEEAYSNLSAEEEQ